MAKQDVRVGLTPNSRLCGLDCIYVFESHLVKQEDHVNKTNHWIFICHRKDSVVALDKYSPDRFFMLRRVCKRMDSTVTPLK